MPNDVSTAEIAETPRLRERIEATLEAFASDDRARSLALALFVVGVALMFMYRPFSQTEVGDSAGYDYIAQSILRGQLPYRDVVDMKTPGSMYLSAFAIAAGRMVGLADVIAVRLLQALLVGLLCVVTFEVGRVYMRSTFAGLIASLLPLTSNKFAEWMIGGSQPKLPMILFGMLSLLFIAKGRPFWAGLTSMLSFLCWQPGLMFSGVAFLVFSRYLTSWRDGRAARVLIGAALPLGLVLVYFYSRGALEDLWAWTITFNVDVFGPETRREPLKAANHIWSVTKRAFGPGRFAAFIGVAGFAMFAVRQARAKLRRESGELFRDALIIPPLIYFVFCLINMQSGPDLIPFIPFFGLFAGWFAVQLGRAIYAAPRRQPARDPIRWELLVPASVAASLLLVAIGLAATYRISDEYTLQHQKGEFRQIEDLLASGDRVYVHGYAELLVLLNRPNMNAYPFFNQGIDRFAAARRGGDFNVILDEMERQRPKLVVLSRLGGVSGEALRRWVGEYYVKIDSFPPGNAYVRKDD